MHFRKFLDPTCFSAEDFIDQHFNPIKKTYTIKGVSKDKPPAGGKPKACFQFVEDPRKAFLGNKEIKFIARQLRQADTDDWVGARVQITCGPKKNPMGGPETTGMVVVNAAYPKGHKHYSQNAQQVTQEPEKPRDPEPPSDDERGDAYEGP